MITNIAPVEHKLFGIAIELDNLLVSHRRLDLIDNISKSNLGRNGFNQDKFLLNEFIIDRFIGDERWELSEEKDK